MRVCWNLLFIAVSQLRSYYASNRLRSFGRPSEAVVTCNVNNTLIVKFEYYKAAEIISVQYGNCDMDSVGDVVITKDHPNHSILVDINNCGMNPNLGTVNHEHLVKVVLGRETSSGARLTFARLDVEAECAYVNDYSVAYMYGTLFAHQEVFDNNVGKVLFDFSIDAYEQADFLQVSAVAPTQAGSMIHLGITVTTAGFNHERMKFIPKSCLVTEVKSDTEIQDTGAEKTYTLFDDTMACTNTDINLVMDYNHTSHVWEVSHILFLLGHYTSSSYELVCDLVVCDYEQTDSDCNTIARQCAGITADTRDRYLSLA